MAIDRRSLLLGTIAFVGAAPFGRAFAAGGSERDVAFVSAARRAAGDFCVLLLRADGSVVRDIALSGRGHDIAIHRPSGRVVVFARRPGTFAVAFETLRATPPQIFAAAEGRHYYGHGAFSSDGRLLYASENDIAGARGVIGIYDVARGYKKIGEHPSYGMGPHEILLLADGKTLAVANGGLDTVPDAGRENLNVDAMEASLAFVDAESGTLLAKHAMTGELKSLSIRHVTQDATGLVWFGGQWEGAPAKRRNLSAAPGVTESFDSSRHPLRVRPISRATSARWRSAPTAASSRRARRKQGTLSTSIQRRAASSRKARSRTCAVSRQKERKTSRRHPASA